MKVLVTGGAGFIGSYVCELLLERGHEVICVDNLSKGIKERIKRHFGNDRFWFHEIDVLNKATLFDIGKDCEGIIHLVASKIPRYGSAMETLLLNANATKNILDLATFNRCKVVLASTSDVYGKNPKVPFHEDDDLLLGSTKRRRWAYASSKIFDEHLAFAYQDEHSIPVVMLRYFGTYGPHCYINWWGGPQGVFIDAILNGREIDIHGDGTQTRCFSYVADTAYATVLALEKEDIEGQIINIGTAEEISILALAKLIHNLSGKDGNPAIKYIPYKSFTKGYEDVMRRVPDISKAQKSLGFEPKIFLAEGLRQTIEWQKNLSEDLYRIYSLNR